MEGALLGHLLEDDRRPHVLSSLDLVRVRVRVRVRVKVRVRVRVGEPGALARAGR